MPRYEYDTINSTNPDDILSALADAIEEGKDGVRIIAGKNRDKIRIVDVPDKNELLVLRDIVNDYESLTAGGNSLTLDGSEENVRIFVHGLMRIIQDVEPQDVPLVHKNRRDVENELVLSVFNIWDAVLAETSNEMAPHYGIVFSTDVEVMRTVFRNAVAAQMFDSSSTENDFLYYFGGLSLIPPSGKLKWLRSQVELTSFIAAFSGDSFMWTKAKGIFLVRAKDGTYKDVVPSVLKQTYSRDCYNDKVNDRIQKYRKELIPSVEVSES